MSEYNFRLIISGPEGFSQAFDIPHGTTKVGRQVGNDLVLDHGLISRQHVQFNCSPSECQIVDLGSSNGTYVDGEKIDPHIPIILKSGSLVKVGPFSLAVESTSIEKIIDHREKAEKEFVITDTPQPSVPGVRAPKIKVEEFPEYEESVATSDSPPPIIPIPPIPQTKPEPEDEDSIPPGLSLRSSHLINFLPGIYHTDFMFRFLAIFEAILTPIEWTVDNFDLYLSPKTSPQDFLLWLANWFDLTKSAGLDDHQFRKLLSEAHKIFARRGTLKALEEVLEIYTGFKPEIDDLSNDLEPFTFIVKFPISRIKINPQSIERIIDADKPAHTMYRLEFTG